MPTTHHSGTATGARATSGPNQARDHKRKVRAAGLAKLIRGMRADGCTYQQIRDQLSVSARVVEDALGEVKVLHEKGRTHADIGEFVGLPRTTVQRLIRAGRESRPTARTNAAAELICDMYGIQLDVLAEFLGMDLSHVRTLARQLRKDGLMMPQLIAVQPGEKWLIPTRDTASSYLGWEVRSTWRPPRKDAEHYRAVAVARAMLVGMDLDAWVSERRLRREAELAARGTRSHTSRLVGHIHDGRFLGVVDGTYGWWALEVELTAKSAKNMDRALRGAITAARDAQPEPLRGVLYLCRGGDVLRVVDDAQNRLPKTLGAGLLAIGDLDAEWREFRTTRRTIRAANRSPNPNHRRRRGTTSPKDESR
ncbi:hypothetical protein [Nocardia sp. bgisy118]|uniref:hypothetical protein n=1 Tax=Nocardia sp. bgisy118 TaxID=3413786 RepID=UPI003F49BFE7